MRRPVFSINKDGFFIICIPGLSWRWVSGVILPVRITSSLRLKANLVCEMEHFVSGSSSQEGLGSYSKCVRCSKAIPLGACRRPLSLAEEEKGILIVDEHFNSHRMGSFHIQASIGPSQGLHPLMDNIQEKEDLWKHIHDLEVQIHLVRNENLEFKRVLTRLYTLAQCNHSKVKFQSNKIVDKVEHLEETLGLCFPHKARKKAKIDASSSEMKDIERKMDKLKRFMVQAENFVDLSNDKKETTEFEGAIMDTGLLP